MKLTGAEILCESLVREGVDVLFGYPGGSVLPLYDTFPKYPQLHHVLVRHEQGASLGADGYARATGRVGVCLATSGPGATNLVTGICNAYMDSVPMVAITGQVARGVIGRDAFQESDVTGITLPITKNNYLVFRAEDIPRVIREAFYIASTGRPGPVLVDIPRDVFQEHADFHWPERVFLKGYHPYPPIDPAQVHRAASMINQAHRPIIIAGHGVLISKAWDELRELAEKAQIPVITTLLGLGSFPESHILSMGMPGMHGMMWNNLAINACDVLIATGMRFDDRVTGRLNAFAAQAQVVHFDLDASEVGKNVRPHAPVLGDVKQALQMLNQEIQPNTHGPWLIQIDEWRREHPSLAVQETDKLLPQFVLKTMRDTVGSDAVFVTGVGQHQMWAAQHLLFDKPYSLLTSGGLGTMGYEIPAAVGAQLGRPDAAVWTIAGDGGFQMTMHELGTMVQERLPIKIALFNNGSLGMVRQWQNLFYRRNFVASEFDFNPDFVKLAEAYGIKAVRVTAKDQVRPAIEEAIAHPGPVLIDFWVEREEDVYPMVPPGAAIGDTIEDPRHTKSPVK